MMNFPELLLSIALEFSTPNTFKSKANLKEAFVLIKHEATLPENPLWKVGTAQQNMLLLSNTYMKRLTQRSSLILPSNVVLRG
ncbi:MAG: hypothetical protein RML14_07775 [Meiothermus sp.]|uniref:hypothetical protein n=1 Tax=Meiothermus sp. TaxID=1955249 RepID=UPI00298EFCD6|nr:hypothetical protein [Meiothermus sp.]MDW8481759.1 hypothetical protein [Meiothermus sp.]